MSKPELGIDWNITTVPWNSKLEDLRPGGVPEDEQEIPLFDD